MSTSGTPAVGTVDSSTCFGNAVVVGGAGAVGRMFADLLRRSGTDVCVVDTAASPAADGLRWYRDDVTAMDPRLVAEIGRADVVVLAVPERVALDAIEPVAGALRPDALLADTLSVKGPIVEAARKVVDGAQMVSLNPMFAPSLGIEGRPVAAVVVNDGPRARHLLHLVTAWGGRVVPMTEGQHDRVAAATQALTHAAVLAFGLALAELEDDVAESAAVAPPPYVTLLALLARITSAAPHAYWDVQSANPHAASARAALAGGLRRLTDLVERGDEAGFGIALDRLRGLLGPDVEHYRTVCSAAFSAMTTTVEGEERT
jgi:prephenate dehydrogenase